MNPSPKKRKGAALPQTAEALQHTGTANPYPQPDKTLRQSEDQYRMLFEQMTGGCIVLEVLCDAVGKPVDHRLLQANARFDEMTGLKRSEQVGRTSANLGFKWPPEVASRYYQIALHGGDLHAERFNESLQRWYDIRSFSPLKGQFALVFYDITERKLAEQRLRESQERYALAEWATQDGLWDWNLLTGEDYFSPRWKEIIGYRDDEIANQESTFLELLHPDDVAAVNEATRGQLEKGERYQVEFRLRHQDGGYRWVLSRGGTVRDATGRPIRMVGAVKDITERKRAENFSAMSAEVLQILNAPGDSKFAMQEVLHVMKRRAEVDAVGIRLQDGNDFPYIVQTGFSDSFLRTENSLASRTVAGGLCRDKDGRVVLECTCGLILSGQVSSNNPLATPKGSIWTNDSSALLGLPAAADPRLHPRNQCIHQGFASVMLVPIRCHSHILGLIQFNDRRKDRFTLKMVEQLEEIAEHLGLALLRKQAEEALRRSEERYALVEQATNDGLWDWNLLTDAEYFSPRWKEIIGLQADEIPGHKSEFLKRVHPEDLPRVQAMTSEHLATNRRYEVEFRLRHQDGSYRWVVSRGQAVRDPAGHPVRMVGSTADITTRKQAERTNARLAAIVEFSNDAIISKDRAGIIQSWNQGAEAMFGYLAAEMIGDSIRKLIPPERQLEEDKILQKVLAGESVNHYETVRLSRTGQLIPVSITVSPIKDQAGNIVGASKVARDITNQKLVEEQIKVQISALTATANAIVITDRHGKIEWVNPAFCKLTGYSAHEAIGRNARILKSDQHPPAFYGTLWATILTGNVWHGELVNKRKDGRLYNEEMTITPVRGADGQIAHFVAVKQDITERRQIEEKLRQGQKMEAIGTLAGGIAHDFNNILGAMSGYAYLLEGDIEGNRAAQESVTEILKAVNRAKDLVQQILTFSRQRESVRLVIRLDTVIKEAMKFLRASLPAHIQFNVQFGDEAPTVLANPTQIYQVVLNLATNALHAMEGRGGVLTLKLEAFLPDRNFLLAHPEFQVIPYARLTVADTGHGMDAKTLERIFEPFFTTKPVGKGTGLGLAVVHGIIKDHDGLITVDSQVGLGTAFCLYFPAKTSDTVLAEATQVQMPEGNGETILVVDDEAALANILQKLLHRLNYQVAITSSSIEALDWVRQNPGQFDLVITDLTMPEMNGVALAEQIRRIRPEMPIILVSGYSGSISEDSLRQAGIQELIDKPVPPHTLAEAVHRALGKFKRT